MSTNIKDVHLGLLIHTRSEPLDKYFVTGQLVTIVLILSGLAHLSLYLVIPSDWEGPIAPRKPALFGISAGLTAWSLLWCANALGRNSRARMISTTIAWALFAEVTLITIQFWRGVPSHFNRSTWIDAGIETAMVGLIVSVTMGIAWMCRFSLKPIDIDLGQRLAIRGGLWLLFVSCLLGFVAMFAGESNLRTGRPPEIWRSAGVLKYPHGAALHALQTLPLLNWLMKRIGVTRRVLMIQFLIRSHGLFLFHAIWQTWAGRSRFDIDFVGGLSLVACIAFFLVPISVTMVTIFSASEKVGRDCA